MEEKQSEYEEEKHGTIMREMPAENNAKKNTREQNESQKI